MALIFWGLFFWLASNLLRPLFLACPFTNFQLEIVFCRNCCLYTFIFCFSLPGQRSQHALFAKPVSPGSVRWTRPVRQIRRYTRKQFLVELLQTFLCLVVKATTFLDHRWALIPSFLVPTWFTVVLQCLHLSNPMCVVWARSLLPVPQSWARGASTELPCLPVAMGTLILPWSSTNSVDVHTLQRSTDAVPALSLVWVLKVHVVLILVCVVP